MGDEVQTGLRAGTVRLALDARAAYHRGMMEYEVIDRKTIYEGPLFTLMTYHVRGRSGKTGQRDVIVHGGAAVILPVLDDGRIVMIRNQRVGVNKTLWELPAGTLGPGELPADAAARELIEETGYQAAAIKPLLAFYPTPGICTERMNVFLATGLRHVGQALEDTEHIEVEAVEMDRALDMIRRGEIEDAKTIASILHYHTFGGA